MFLKLCEQILEKVGVTSSPKLRRATAVIIICLTSLIAHRAHATVAGPQTITLDAKLTDSTGTTPLLDASVVIDIKIYNPAASCIIYSEHQTVDTTMTEGRFSVLVGSVTGASKRVVGVDSGNPMVTVFSNNAPIAGSACTYTPAAGDTRLMRITVSPSSTGTMEQLTPDTVIDSVPFALMAESLQGLDRDHVLAIDSTTTLSQTNVANIFSSSNYPILTSLLAGTNAQYVKSSSNGAVIPSVSGTPSATTTGQIWFNSSANAFQYYNGTAIQTLGMSGSGISSLAVGSSLTSNGVASTSVASGNTLDIIDSGVTAGTYPKVTVNQKGLVTYGTGLSEADIPTLSSAGKVSGSTITSGTIGGMTSFYSSGNVTAQNITSGVDATRQLQLFDPAAGSTHKITISAPTLATDYSIVFPATVGSAGYALTTDGSGNLSWASVASGSLPSLASGKIWVGNSSAVATAVTPFGDLTISIAGSGSVTGLRGSPISILAPSMAGQMLRWDGGAWAPGFVAMTDLRSTVTGTNAFQNTCASNQTLTYNSVGDQMSCSNIAITSNQITWGSTGANLVFAGPSTGGAASPTFRSLTAADLPAGTVSQWNTVSSTINYVLGGVGIGTATPQAVLDVYGTGSSSAMLVPRDTTAARPAGVSGMLRYNTSTNSMEIFAGSAWTSIATGASGASQWTTSAANIYYGSGNVGIGTATPSYNIDVVGSANVSSSYLIRGLNAVAIPNANSVAVGNTAAATNSTAGLHNSAVGTQALNSNTSGDFNTAVGFQALNVDYAWSNTGIGAYSLAGNTSGGNNTGVGYGSGSGNVNGSANTFIGTNSGRASSTTSNNTSIGESSLYVATGANNTAIGQSAGFNLTTGNNNVLLGQNAGFNLGSGSNNIVLGSNATVAASTGDNQLSIGNLIYGNLSTSVIGIGTSAPAAALDVVGTATTNSALIVPRATIAQRPSSPVNGMIRYQIDGQTLEAYVAGAWSPLAGGGGSGSSQWTTSSSNIYYGTGNVGIGTSSPAQALDIVGNEQVSGSILLKGSSAQLVTWASNFPAIQSSVTNGTTYFTVIPNGSSTSASLMVSGASAYGGTNYSSLTQNAANVSLTNSSSSGSLTLGTNGGSQFTLLANGNVGVGTSNPLTAFSLYKGGTNAGMLTIEGDGGNGQRAGVRIRPYSGLNNQSYAGFLGIDNGSSSARAAIYVPNSPTAPTDVTEAVSVLPGSGNVGIGTSAPAALLDVFGSANTNSAIIVPRATIAQRPTSPVNGMIRYQIDNQTLETYTAGSWLPIATGAGSSQWTTSGSNIYYGSGNVAIGTTTPLNTGGQGPAILIGSEQILQSVVGNQMMYSKNAYYDGSWKYLNSDSATAIRMNNDPGDGSINFHLVPPGTGNSALPSWDSTAIKMTIRNGGNVGIGTTNPVSTLQVNGNLTVTQSTETAVNLGTSLTGTVNLSLASGTYFYGTITGATTFTTSGFAAAGYVSDFTIELTNAGSQSITWMSGTKWPGGVPPTFTSSGTDIVVCSTRDGAVTWRCVGSEMNSF